MDDRVQTALDRSASNIIGALQGHFNGLLAEMRGQSNHLQRVLHRQHNGLQRMISREFIPLRNRLQAVQAANTAQLPRGLSKNEIVRNTIRYRFRLRSNGNNNGERQCDSCPICIGEFKEREVVRRIRNCRHVFHAECVDQWLKSNSKCPMCRQDVKKQEDNPNEGQQDIQNEIARNSSEENNQENGEQESTVMSISTELPERGMLDDNRQIDESSTVGNDDENGNGLETNIPRASAE